MTTRTVKKHIDALHTLFPCCFVAPSEEFDGRQGGLWTDFGENVNEWGERIIDFWEGSKTCDELQEYLDANNLFIEPHDPATYMIWSSDGS